MENWMNANTRSVLKCLTLIAVLLVRIISAKVNLITEGNVSLVGLHCPGSVKIFCEGTDLTFLRWTFNDGIEITKFLTNRDGAYPPSPYQSQSFVQLIELTKAVLNPDPRFGNFSSILTFDLSKLEEENVTNISCDDALTTKTVTVGVTIIKQVIPDSPNITEVTATYASARLRSVTLAWNAVEDVSTVCRTSVISYTASISDSQGETLSSVNMDSENCLEGTCSARLVISTNVLMLTVTLSANNSAWSSARFEYDNQIYGVSTLYYQPTITLLNCYSLYVVCSRHLNLNNNSQCLLRYYGDDVQYQQLTRSLAITVNGEPELLVLQEATEHYFTLSLMAGPLLQIQEYFVYSTRHICMYSTPEITIIIVVAIVTVSAAFCFLGLILGVIRYLTLSKRNRKKCSSDHDTGQEQINERLPSPVYEEIDNVHFHLSSLNKGIELQKNSAYAQPSQHGCGNPSN